MKTFLACLLVCLGLVCSAAEPATAKPLFPVVVTCFMGKLDSRSSASTRNAATPASNSEGKWSSGMTCGWAGQVSELRWEFLGSEDGADVYRMTRRFPADSPAAESTTRTIRFAGKRVVVFEDKFQVIVLDPEKAALK